MVVPAGPAGIQSTIGPLFIGLLLSIGFQGILVAQGYVYWRTFGDKDSRLFRNAVFGLCILELFHSIISIHAGYWYLVINYNTPVGLNYLVWSIITELALTVLITFIGRAFWIKWLYSLSHKNWWITSITSAFSLAQLGLGIGEVYEGIRKPYFSTVTTGKVAIVAQILSADVGDVIISVSLCYYLHVNRTGIRRTERLIDRLMMFIVTRGILASGTGFVQLITYLIWPDTFIFGIFHLIASKLYTNALLATLNLRPHHSNSRPIHSSYEEETGTSFVLSSVSPNTEIRHAFDTKTDPITSIDDLAGLRQTQSHSVVLPTASSSGSEAGPYISMTIEKGVDSDGAVIGEPIGVV